MQTTSQEISLKVKTKKQLYEILAKKFYLPKYESRAISRNYLLNFILKDIPIFTMKRAEIIHYNFRHRHKTSCELLEILEDLLKKKELPPTGLTALSLPDRSWLLNCILYLDGDDENQLLSRRPDEKITYNLEVNAE